MDKRAAIDPSVFSTLGPFCMGDRVRIPWGSDQIEATVVEDLGPLGLNGKRIYGLAFRVDDVSDEIYVQRDVDELTLVTRALGTPPTPQGKKRLRG